MTFFEFLTKIFDFTKLSKNSQNVLMLQNLLFISEHGFVVSVIGFTLFENSFGIFVKLTQDVAIIRSHYTLFLLLFRLPNRICYFRGICLEAIIIVAGGHLRCKFLLFTLLDARIKQIYVCLRV